MSKVLLLDIMSTVVYDPFWELPKFFGQPMDELLKDKDPTAWVEFERDEIDEATFYARFFADGKAIDGPGMKQTMRDAYAFLDGMDDLLADLKSADVEMHALSNYPVWYRMIEEKLSLSDYLEWSFVSCHTGHRKPEPQAYSVACDRLELPPEHFVFVDDRGSNCKAAAGLGMTAIKFEGAASLRGALSEHFKLH